MNIMFYQQNKHVPNLSQKQTLTPARTIETSYVQNIEKLNKIKQNN